MIISPVSPGPAIKLGSAEQNPLFGELMDIFNTASALCGLTAISLPIGFESVEDEKGAKDLPIGIQLFTSKFQEMKILNTGLALERLYGGFEHSLDKVNI
jgi:aspartyl-tRNA(Asn)/glutamyl-tRNA(Gln) amidotransferase subunit A